MQQLMKKKEFNCLTETYLHQRLSAAYAILDIKMLQSVAVCPGSGWKIHNSELFLDQMCE